jgi:hypothetical protein
MIPVRIHRLDFVFHPIDDAYRILEEWLGEINPRAQIADFLSKHAIGIDRDPSIRRVRIGNGLERLVP